jgi:hypothetical protein
MYKLDLDICNHVYSGCRKEKGDSHRGHPKHCTYFNVRGRSTHIYVSPDLLLLVITSKIHGTGRLVNNNYKLHPIAIQSTCL